MSKTLGLLVGLLALIAIAFFVDLWSAREIEKLGGMNHIMSSTP